MLYFVVERFRNADPLPVRDRFQREGRLMPEGVAYVGSWIDPLTACCYQVMASPSRELIDLWASRWSDIVDLEIVEVLASTDYWASIDATHPR